MYGSNQKPFVSFSYKSDELEKLANRAVDGVRSNKIKPVDYDKLRNLTAEKKFSGHKTLLKVKKLEHLSKQNKESHLLKQHKLVWQKEFLRLNNLRKKLQMDVAAHERNNLADGNVCAKMYHEFQDYQISQEKDFAKFKESTAEPVWNLRSDLQYWLQENMEDLRLGAPEAVKKHTEIRQTAASVTAQQQQMMQRLHHEQMCLERELNIAEFSDLGMNNLERRPHIEQGIPEEAFDISCPDEDLKAQVLKEFIILDEKYLERLNMLEESHAAALSTDKSGGWTEEEHAQFVTVYDQYTSDLANRRMLLMDRLKREFPRRTRPELVSHEQWWDCFKYFHQRCRGIMYDWQRDRRELMDKARFVFTEACIAHELDEVKQEYSRRHKALRDVLYEQVRQWREHKLEMMEIQEDIWEQHRSHLLEKQTHEHEMERKKRDEDKRKIQDFLEEKDQTRKEKEEQDRRRLEEIQKALDEQAVFDRERVKYRESQIERKLEERRFMEEERDLEEQEREYRLERLRDQVRVVADSNPERMMSDTRAWQARLAVDESVDINKPLFNLHGFTSTQVTTDNRVRLEQKLRDAGLHNSEYARKMMKTIPPPQPPRRDMESNVFKFDET